MPTSSQVEMAEKEEVDEIGCGISSALTSLSPEHYEKIVALIKEIPETVNAASDGPITHYEAEKSLEKFKEILDLYQEQPHLLDSQLPSLIDPLLGYVRDGAKEKGYEAAIQDPVVCFAFQFLLHLSKVRGYKVMIRWLPHEVEDVSLALGLAEAAGSGGEMWAARCVLLLWLLLLAKIPFSLAAFDGACDGPLLADRLLALARRHAASSDRSQPVAARLLAALLTRADLKAKHLRPGLEELLRDLDADILSVQDGYRNTDVGHRITGLVTVLAAVLKTGDREDLRPHASWLLQAVTKLRLQALPSSLLQKFRLKILQRIALLFLRPKLANWRYQFGARSLALGLQGDASTAHGAGEAGAGLEAEEDEGYDVAEDVETVIGELLSELGNAESVVRWSAAKGLGRVASRLPQALAEEVVEEVQSALSSRNAWHGGILSLAELGRRGVLLPTQLGRLIPLLLKALVYEEVGGRVSVGAAVRDAGCFLAWSLARTFRPADLQPHVDALAAGLLGTALLDRELHCRRAASAAFQENVGRQGSFPDGLEILRACDYYAVGQVGHCYSELVPFVATFPVYRTPLSQALLTEKVAHWDPNIRRLAADALGRLAKMEPEWMVDRAIESLVPIAFGNHLFGRQGALFALGEIISALLQLKEGSYVSSSLIEEVSKLPGEAVRRGLVKGMGSEWVRSGLNSLMDQLGGLPIWRIPSLTILKEWQQLLHENLHHSDKGIRDGYHHSLP